jgi:hypothetical protein
MLAISLVKLHGGNMMFICNKLLRLLLMKHRDIAGFICSHNHDICHGIFVSTIPIANLSYINLPRNIVSALLVRTARPTGQLSNGWIPEKNLIQTILVTDRSDTSIWLLCSCFLITCRILVIYLDISVLATGAYVIIYLFQPLIIANLKLIDILTYRQYNLNGKWIDI